MIKVSTCDRCEMVGKLVKRTHTSQYRSLGNIPSLLEGAADLERTGGGFKGLWLRSSRSSWHKLADACPVAQLMPLNLSKLFCLLTKKGIFMITCRVNSISRKEPYNRTSGLHGDETLCTVVTQTRGMT